MVRSILALASVSVACTPLKDDVALPDASIPDSSAPADSGGPTDSDGPGANGSPFTLAVPRPHVNIVRGQTANVDIVLTRSSADAGSVVVTVAGLPAAVTADPLTLANSDTKASLTLHAEAIAPLGPRVSLTLTGTAGAVHATATFDILVQDPPGTRDTTFGTNGIAIIEIGQSAERIGGQGLALQADGKIVLCGLALRPSTTRDEAFGLARLLSNGSLDGKFGFQGTFLTPEGENGLCGTVNVLPDHRIVMAGFLTTQTSHAFIGARFTEDGAIDPSFGNSGGGYYQSLLGASEAKAFALAVQPDGHMVLGGYAGTASTMLRLDGSGTPDTFGPNGSGDLRAITPDGVISGIALYPDGRIAASIAGGPGFRVVRISPTGALDMAYGDNGIASAPSGTQYIDASGQLVLQPDGKVVVVGSETPDGGPADAIRLARFTQGGKLDATFGTGGTTTTTAVGGNASGTAIALLPDGSFAVAAVLPGADGPSFGVARYTSAGVIDKAFGSGGLTSLSLGDLAVAQAIAIDSDGRILVAGIVGSNAKKAVVARFWP